MSALEEAREQARKALAPPIDEVGTGVIISALHLRTLLDATEPRPITDEMVEAAAGADFEFGKESMTWDAWAAHDSDHAGWLRKKARAALEAAEEARR